MEVAVHAGIVAANDPKAAARRAGERALARLREDADTGAAPVADTAWADAFARDFPASVIRRTDDLAGRVH